MSYCRTNSRREWGPLSNCYLFGSVSGYLELYVNTKINVTKILGAPEGKNMYGEDLYSFRTIDRQEMLDKLHALRQVRVKVPKYATQRLKREIKKYGREF